MPKKESLSLAQQLSLIRTENQHALSIPFVGTSRSSTLPSLVFSPSEAAEYDERTILEVGRSGMAELMGEDPLLFDPWYSRFYSMQELDRDRALLSREANAALDEEIRVFLACLGPYFGCRDGCGEREQRLANACHRSLEWMIRKFRVQVLNVDALLRCAFAWHETEAFVRVLQMVRLDGPSAEKWAFLYDRQREAQLREAVAPGRRFFALRCTKSPAFLDELVENVCMQARLARNRKPDTLYSATALIILDFWSLQKENANENDLIRMANVVDDLLAAGVEQVTKIARIVTIQFLKDVPEARKRFEQVYAKNSFAF